MLNTMKQDTAYMRCAENSFALKSI